MDTKQAKPSPGNPRDSTQPISAFLHPSPAVRGARGRRGEQEVPGGNRGIHPPEEYYWGREEKNELRVLGKHVPLVWRVVHAVLFVGCPRDRSQRAVGGKERGLWELARPPNTTSETPLTPPVHPHWVG